MDQPSSEVQAVPLELDPGEMPDSSLSPTESREEGQEPVTDTAATSTNSPHVRGRAPTRPARFLMKTFDPSAPTTRQVDVTIPRPRGEELLCI